MNKKNYITQEEIKKILDYDKDTGLFTWKVSKAKRIKVGDIAGCVNGSNYIVMRINGKMYFAHRLAWLYVYGKFPDKNIDHINCIKTDNRISNLRNVTNSVNMQNQKQVKGYSKSGSKYRAVITLNRIAYQLGSYDTEDLAREAYLKAKKELHVV